MKLFVILIALFSASATQQVNPKLSVEKKYIMRDGKSFILRGVNIADPQHIEKKNREHFHRTAIEIADYAISRFHANVIRIPIKPDCNKKESATCDNEGLGGWFSERNGGNCYFENHVAPLVDFITSKKVYVIIDLHYVRNYDLKLLERVKLFWEFMAPKYANNPYVIYEIFNEPIYPDDWNHWKNTIAEPVVDLIRKFAPENLIIVGGPSWTQHMSGAANNPIKKTNIVYAIHNYAAENKGKSSEWLDRLPETKRMEKRVEKWRNNFEKLAEDYPIFVTEWGFEEAREEGGTVKAFGEPWLRWMESRGASWTVWSFDTSWPPRMFWCDGELQTGNGGMGEFVRLALQANRPKTQQNNSQQEFRALEKERCPED